MQNLIIKRFEELTVEELYDILRIRNTVFVVEQHCAYQDIDSRDQHAYHVFLENESGIQAYLRVIDKGISFDDVSIGRVLTLKRRCGLGTQILNAGIQV